MAKKGLNLNILETEHEIISDKEISRVEKQKQEYERLKGLIQNSDPVKIELLDGLLREAAKTRVQLDELNSLAVQTGPIRTAPDNPTKQMALPVIGELTKVRASYIHIMDRLMKHLDFSDDIKDDTFGDFL